MTENTQIEAAYERLATALVAPADADRLVAARVAVRRRRRRTTHGVAALAVVATTFGAVTLVGGGSSASRPVAPAPVATATETAARPAPDRTVASDEEQLCGLTGEEALRLVRERHRDEHRDEHPDEHVRDGQLFVSLAELSRATSPCR